MKRKLLIGLLTVCLMLLTISCAAATKEASAPVPAPVTEPSIAPVPEPAPSFGTSRFNADDSAQTESIVPKEPGTVTASATPAEGSGGGSMDIDRMIVRTAQMSLVVTDVPAALEQIAALAEGSDGYVVSSQRWQEDEHLAGFITIRVPAGDFGIIMSALRGLAIEVTSEQTSSQDVTEEYTDLSSSLKNLEATEEQLLQLMEKAEEMDDILNIQRELSRVRGEIEQIKGRMQYLERTSATSLISVQLSEAGLDVSFSANKKTVKEGENIKFESKVSGGFSPYSYEWDFGDGETSTDVNPSHSYKATGYYSVTLKVSDDEGNTGFTEREAYINVLAGWNPGNVARSAWNGLITIGRVVVNILIWVGILIPVWIVIGVIVWLVRRRRRKSRGM